MRALKVVAGIGIYAGPSLDPDRVNRIIVQLGLIVNGISLACSLLELQSIDG